MAGIPLLKGVTSFNLANSKVHILDCRYSAASLEIKSVLQAPNPKILSVRQASINPNPPISTRTRSSTESLASMNTCSLLTPKPCLTPGSNPFPCTSLLSTSRSVKFMCCSETSNPGKGSGESSSSGRRNSDWKKMRSDVEDAMSMNADIPSSATEFLRKVSSKAYEMRGRLHLTMDNEGYDVIESNPYGYTEPEKPLYVLAQREDKLYTMRTRRARSEVENELNMLFPGKWKKQKGGGSSVKNWRSTREPIPQLSAPDEGTAGKGRSAAFKMHVEDVREGVLVFEDEEEAARYCSILEVQGHRCMGIAQVPAKQVFDICNQSNALAVLFRQGTTPPKPDKLQMNLKAKKYSPED